MPTDTDSEEPANTQQAVSNREHHRPQHAAAKHDRRDAPESNEDSEKPEDATNGAPKPAGSGPHHKLWSWIKNNKKVSIPAGVVLLLVLLGAVPFTRYVLAGTVLRKDFSVLVVDSETHMPVTSATVQLKGKQALTNNKGVATIRAAVGNATVTVTKKYYTTAQKGVLVPIGKQKDPAQLSLNATGRQVPIAVTNKVSGSAVANVTIAAQGSEAKTDAKGQAVLVVPADKTTVDATLKGNGYNDAKVTVKVTEGVDHANTFQITPAGRLYFLSNKSGTIDVVKTNLDGSDRKIVLAGTGTEDKYGTVLLASQDWQYLALLSKRDGGDHAKLFLIDTSDDSLTTMDEGDAQFSMVGWSGHRFVYIVNRNGYSNWQGGAQVLKAYDAPSGKITALDQTVAGGNSQNAYFEEGLNNTYIFNDEIVYAKNLFASSAFDASNHQATLNSVKPDGSDKHVIKGWTLSLPYSYYYNSVSVFLNIRAYGPNEIYVAVSKSLSDAAKDTNLYDYEDGDLKTVPDKTPNDLYQGDYFTYLFSPSNNKTFWGEPRDGKNTLFVGDDQGTNPKEVASLSDYQTYGWYTEKYLLVSKNGSELYILPVTGGTPLKITDYYKPNVEFTGYGKGYGGL
ncbi:MAG TPA: hypothetical protein VF466_02260 [Candidatus Saccharimonadales bacterium]